MESGSSRSPDEAVTKPTTDVEKKGSDIEAPASATSGSGRKSGGSKYTGHSILNSVNKSTLQIKKPPHRKSVSPLNWFPRKKTDSFLKRKIKHLQEIGGMNISLDETLGNANPHYTRIAREKIAAQEAAQKAMEARKAAMVEASWCRILGAARIKSKEAEARLGKAEECAAEAFEAARAMGVMMYDRPDCQRRPCEIQTSLAIRGQSTHTVTASFETAFEVDKEVAAAVKRAFVRLANCPSSLNKEEFKDLLCKISQNPDTNGTREDLPEISSECETDPGAELDYDSQISGDTDKKHATRVKQRKHKNSLLPTDGGKGRSISPTELNDTMLDRLKGLQEDELASLAVIVATCGLNAALREMESSKDNDLELISSCTSTLGTGTRRYSSISCIMGDNMQKKEAVTEVPSLDKFLVKHVSRLEREVQEAKRSNVALDNQRTSGTSEPQIVKGKLSNKNQTQVESTLDLGTVLVKHVSKLEKDILESKKNNYKSNSSGKSVELNVEIETQTEILRAKSNAVAPSSDNIPILGGKQSDSKEELLGGISEISHNKVCKQFSSRGLTEDTVHPDSMVMPEKVQRSSSDSRQQNKENIDLIPVNEMHQASKRMSRVERAKIEVLKTFSAQEKNRGDDTHEMMGLDKILVKPIHRLEKEKMQALEQERDKVVLRDRKKQGTNVMAPESLDTILVKHVSRLEKDKLTLAANEGTRTVKKCNQQSKECVESLDEILVKHQSKLEKAELAASQQSADYMKHEARREARERELQEAWGGLSLGNSLRPHLSRIERDKAAWRKAEEEERMREVEP